MVHLAKVEINQRRFAPILDHITGITTSPEYAVWQRFGQNGPFGYANKWRLMVSDLSDGKVLYATWFTTGTSSGFGRHLTEFAHRVRPSRDGDHIGLRDRPEPS